MSDTIDHQAKALELTADIVAAYASTHRLPVSELHELIATVYGTLDVIGSDRTAVPEAVAQVPAVPIKKSITPEYLVCLEDGKRFKSLKRHLRARYGLTPEAYRVKWGLPFDYPMVAPNYAKARSALAREIGLGRQRRDSAA